MKTNSHPIAIKYIDSHPVAQSHQNGKWGFERIYDCYDMRKFIYPSKLSATRARNAEARFTAMIHDTPMQPQP